MNKRVSLSLSLWALGLLVAGTAACQTNTGVFLSLATDLQTPAELASVRMKVTSDEQVTFDNRDLPWLLGPGQEAQLPGSLAFYAEQGSPVASFLVEGLDGDGQVIVTRTAVLSTVPGEMLYLRLTLSRACVAQELGGSLAVGCSDGDTCVEGRCVPAEIDPTTLPRYSAGQEETVLECETTSPFVDTSSGKTLSGSGACKKGHRCQEGVCVEDPGCQSGSCVCPGDICQAQTLALSTGVVQLTASSDDVYFTELGEGTGQGRVRRVPEGGGQPVDVASGLINPGAIRFLDGKLVFADRGNPGNSDGSIHVQIGGPEAEVGLFQEYVPDPTDVWVDGVHVHWLREDGCFKYLSLDTPNEPYSTWVCGPGGAHAFARDPAGTFFWLTADSGVNYSPAAEDGPYVLNERGSSPSDRGGCAAAGDRTLIYSDGATLWASPTDGSGEVQTLTTGTISSLVVDDTGIVVADGDKGTLVHMARSGGDVVTLASDLRNPRSLAFNDKAIFFIEDDPERPGTGRIQRLPRRTR